MKHIEFGIVDDGKIIVVHENSSTFLQEDVDLINEMYDRIEKEYPQAFQALCEFYKKSRPNMVYFKYKVARKFIRCNFGKMDYTQRDVDDDGHFNFEIVDCPCRGECPLENIVCSPIFATGLSRREEEIVKVASKMGGTAEDIANAMSVSVHTIRYHEKSIMKKLNLHSFKDVLLWWEAKGYIKK